MQDTPCGFPQRKNSSPEPKASIAKPKDDIRHPTARRTESSSSMTATRVIRNSPPLLNHESNCGRSYNKVGFSTEPLYIRKESLYQGLENRYPRGKRKRRIRASCALMETTRGSWRRR